ncbi:MAG: nuclear transport factor 2 family protein [Isosphaeraceae bacterium]
MNYSMISYIIVISVAAGAAGCSGAGAPAPAPASPEAVAVLQEHLKAIRGRDWKAAYNLLHPDLAASGLTLKKFTELHARREKTPGFPSELRVVASSGARDASTVEYDLLYTPPGGGEPVAVPPHRRATFRRCGDAWRLTTHDVLAVGNFFGGADPGQ